LDHRSLFGKDVSMATSPTATQTPSVKPISTDPTASDAEFAEALGLSPERLTATEAPPTSDEVHVGDKLLAHFAVNHPGPASFPSIALRILELVRYQDVNLNELAKYIRMDGALASSLLALANSAAYKSVKHIDTIKDAVTRIGLGEVAKLTAAISTRSLYGAEEKSEFQRFAPLWQELFFHAATVARAASEISRKVSTGTGPEQVFMAGVLHDVGKSIALRSLAALEAGGKVPRSSDTTVARVLHQVHVPVGTEMHRKIWGLPPLFADTAAHHHDGAPPEGETAATVQLVRLVSAVYLFLADAELSPLAPGEALAAARALDLSPAQVAAVVPALTEAQAWVGMLYGDPAAPKSR
jgi:putative nucleotidyltransferase with HDIG domain